MLNLIAALSLFAALHFPMPSFQTPPPVRCTCIYCACSQKGQECSCDKAKCDKNKCKCGKWTK